MRLLFAWAALLSHVGNPLTCSFTGRESAVWTRFNGEDGGLVL